LFGTINQIPLLNMVLNLDLFLATFTSAFHPQKGLDPVSANRLTAPPHLYHTFIGAL